MNRQVRRRACATTLAGLLAAVLLCGAPAPARAQVSKPFKIVGAGAGPIGLPLPGQDPRPHWAIGQATELGRYDSEGTVRTDSAAITGPTTIEGEFGSGGPYTFIAANGDKLVVYYGRTDHGADEPGTFTLTILDVLGVTDAGDPILLVKAHWIAEFVVQPDLSTGRFRGVTGSWIMDAFSDPFVLGSDDPVGYSWSGEGRLLFPKGKGH
jgi:hypothetical protein